MEQRTALGDFFWLSEMNPNACAYLLVQAARFKRELQHFLVDL